MHASRIRAYPTLFPLVVAALFSLSILSSSVITVEERERDRKLCRPIVALFKYQKGTMGQREREIGEAVRDGSARRSLFFFFFHQQRATVFYHGAV